ncbi:putative RNA methyltransferase [uncultured Paraglaciecola sp.]|uniref:putative RNA methyltransferase n=1 Tax=uncultured Paraglaciecola sp. TaxID=1765024 RepID=UPI0030DC765A|tara:strand:- start:4854 stop:5720 length:867 start_codon:yes stop_codon:yes gene_type:complete
MWICPACQSPLTLVERTYKCASGHTYDMAREGYVNLLLAQHKRSKEPGDNKLMVNARRSFLEQGYYQPLATRMADVLQQFSGFVPTDDIESPASGRLLNLFDVGCGEGYYLDYVLTRLNGHQKSFVAKGAGLDISKIAVQKAAKKYPVSEFCVASSFAIPLPDASQHSVIQVFAPSSEQEILRVLEDDGVWLQVNPAAEHLTELKACIYAAPAEHKPALPVPEGFELCHEETVTFSFTLDTSDMRMNLLMMTPYYWSTSVENTQRIKDLLRNVSAHFSLRLLRKTAVR